MLKRGLRLPHLVTLERESRHGMSALQLATSYALCGEKRTPLGHLARTAPHANAD